MTALDDTAHKVEGFRLGAVDYVTKPIQREELVARIQHHLQLHRLQRELLSKSEISRRRMPSWRPTHIPSRTA